MGYWQSAAVIQLIWLWDREQDRYEQALRGHTAEVTGLTFVPDSSSLLSGSEDGTLRLWDVVGGQCTRIIKGHVDSLTVVDWSPDGTQVVSGGANSLITIYATSGEPPPQPLRSHGTVFGLGWSADGHHIASNERTNSIRLWDATSGDSLGVLQYPDNTFSFYFDVAWVQTDDTWRVERFGTVCMFSRWRSSASAGLVGDPSLDPSCVLESDGTRVAGTGDDAAVYLWDVATDVLLYQWHGHHAAAQAVTWSPDGTRLASGSGDTEGGEVCVWDVERGGQLSRAWRASRQCLRVSVGCG